MTCYAFCDRSGVIDFGPAVPEGQISFYEAASYQECFDRVSIRARHGSDGKTLLVPGIPEATSENAAYAALALFSDWMEK